MIRELPQKLKTLRIKYGYSQKLVAEKLDVSPSIISVHIPVKRRACSGGTACPFRYKRRNRSVMNGVKRLYSV